MNASTTTPKTSLTGRCLPFEITIAGFLIRLICQGGKLWVSLRDIHAILEYRSLKTGAVRRIFEIHGHDFYSFTLRLAVGRNAALFINDEGLRLVCDLLKPERTQNLRRWLDEGGMQQAQKEATEYQAKLRETLKTKALADEMPPKTAKMLESLNTTATESPAPKAVAAPLQPGDRIRSIHAKRPGFVVRTYGDGSAAIHWDDREPQPFGFAHERMPRHLLELVSRPDPAAAKARRKDYTRELCRVIARYADDAEALELARALEDVSARILARRYCPGLNAAAYDVFARYGMKDAVTRFAVEGGVQ